MAMVRSLPDYLEGRTTLETGSLGGHHALASTNKTSATRCKPAALAALAATRRMSVWFGEVDAGVFQTMVFGIAA